MQKNVKYFHQTLVLRLYILKTRATRHKENTFVNLKRNYFMYNYSIFQNKRSGTFACIMAWRVCYKNFLDLKPEPDSEGLRWRHGFAFLTHPSAATPWQHLCGLHFWQHHPKIQCEECSPQCYLVLPSSNRSL